VCKTAKPFSEITKNWCPLNFEPGSGRPIFINKNIQEDQQTNETFPGFTNMRLRAIQHVFLKTLKLPFSVMAKKPLLTHRIKDQRMEFSHHYGYFGVDDWKKVMFSDEPLRDFETRAPAAGSRRSSPRNCQASS
jgi:hypothetical protein